MRFVDANVLLYAVSTDPDERLKADVARSLLDGSDLALSAQVLQEFYVQSTRVGKLDRLSHEQASRLVESWLRYPVKEIDVTVVRAAMATADRFGISYWDAAILEAARSLECDTVLTEDLAAGRDYDGVVVVDPFL